MVQHLANHWGMSVWLVKIGLILLFFLAAWVLHRLSRRLAGRAVRLNQLTDRKRRLSSERQATLQGLISSSISTLAFVFATMAGLGLFVSSDTVVWVVGLFGAAFGLSARPLVSDLFAGLGFIFDDTYSVGEKISVLEVEGVVEEVNLRTTHIRAVSGELYVVPNGDIRVISESGAIGQATELTLLAKARFGTGADLRPQLLALVQERLSAAGIPLVSY